MNSRLHKEVTELATEGELGEQLSPSLRLHCLDGPFSAAL